MGTQQCHTLHVFLFPFLAYGHMIPTVDMAKLFAEKGVKVTIITTPLNAPFLSKSIANSQTSANNIHIQTIKFPCEEAGLPNGCECLNYTTSTPDLLPKFYNATRLLQEPFEQLLLEQHPDCVVADMLFPWATDSTSKFGIPSLVFHGFSFFSLCTMECMRLYKPYNNVSSDSESFLVPHLPGEIKMTRMQLPPHVKGSESTCLTKMFCDAEVLHLRSYGVLVNSFYELESVYADYYRKMTGKKAWHIGPLSLCNKGKEEKAHRGKEAPSNEHECLKWLDTKQPSSVVYVCSGSLTSFGDSQLREIALGLEASGQEFVWVVSKSDKEGEEWLPEGFEKRMKDKGMMIRGWAPQVLILEHEAVGAFVTHCGWNSTLEAVSAGVPMVTWPMAAEQFYNEKLVTEVLKIGVPIGVGKWGLSEEEIIEWNKVEKVVRRIMNGEEANEMRNKAKVLSQLAGKAVERGGSSYCDLNALVDDLNSLQLCK